MTPTGRLRALREALARGAKGPWSVGKEGADGYCIQVPTDLHVACYCFNGQDHDADVDAQLIVAAINNLEALLDVAEAAHQFTEYAYQFERIDPEVQLCSLLHTRNALRAALARLGDS